jgi:hypothetical protein
MAAGDVGGAPQNLQGGLRRSICVALWAVVLMSGCSAPGKPLIESPLPVSQQQQAVLDVVPRGTSRGEAEKRLRAAGIEFTPGGNGSIYYLSLWNRPDGTRWHISVALLFDSAGKLYESRPADSATGLVSTTPTGSGERLTEGRDSSTASRPPVVDADGADDSAARLAFPANDAPLRRSMP